MLASGLASSGRPRRPSSIRIRADGRSRHRYKTAYEDPGALLWGRHTGASVPKLLGWGLDHRTTPIAMGEA